MYLCLFPFQIPTFLSGVNSDNAVFKLIQCKHVAQNSSLRCYKKTITFCFLFFRLLKSPMSIP